MRVRSPSAAVDHRKKSVLSPVASKASREHSRSFRMVWKRDAAIFRHRRDSKSSNSCSEKPCIASEMSKSLMS